MSEDLRVRFMPRFVTTARARMTRAHERLGARDPGGVALELHACGGEAGVLGLDDVLRLSVQGELAARAWRGGGDEAQALTCARCIDSIVRELDKLG